MTHTYIFSVLSDRSFRLVDTPGLNDPEPGKDSRNIEEMVGELKKINHINVFLIVFNGSNPRFEQPLIDMLRVFCNAFGQDFLEFVVFEIANWGLDAESERKRGSKNEEYWSGELNKKFHELVRLCIEGKCILNPQKWNKDNAFHS